MVIPRRDPNRLRADSPRYGKSEISASPNRRVIGNGTSCHTRVATANLGFFGVKLGRSRRRTSITS